MPPGGRDGSRLSFAESTEFVCTISQLTPHPVTEADRFWSWVWPLRGTTGSDLSRMMTPGRSVDCSRGSSTGGGGAGERAKGSCVACRFVIACSGFAAVNSFPNVLWGVLSGLCTLFRLCESVVRALLAKEPACPVRGSVWDHLAGGWRAPARSHEFAGSQLDVWFPSPSWNWGHHGLASAAVVPLHVLARPIVAVAPRVAWGEGNPGRQFRG